MDGWMNGWMDGWMDAWMHGYMDGYMDGWMDRWMDGWRGRAWQTRVAGCVKPNQNLLLDQWLDDREQVVPQL